MDKNELGLGRIRINLQGLGRIATDWDWERLGRIRMDVKAVHGGATMDKENYGKSV